LTCDLIGYGRSRPRPVWPREARAAVQFDINYEEGGEKSIVHGDATSEAFLSETVGAQLIVRVTARAIFPNCPRYIPTMAAVEPSIYVPQAGRDAPEPAWKGFADFKDCIHPRQPTFKG
jgi:hypothetical protein